MKIKKIISLTLSVIMLLSVANMGFSAYAASATVAMCTGSTGGALAVGLDDVCAVQFNALQSFSEIDISCPSWSDNLGGFSVALCKWQTDYLSTIDSTPLASTRFMDYNDNTTNCFKFPSQPVGMYVLKLFGGTSNQAGFWYRPGGAAKGTRLICNNRDMNAGIVGNIIFDSSADEYFGELPEFYMAGSSTPPAESDIFVDSAIAENGVDPSSWTAVDGLGRTVSTSDVTGETDESKTVGCFYWLWHSHWAGVTAPINTESILKMYPEAINDYNHAAWYQQSGSVENFWDVPTYGYYSTVDEYVIRKQAELLADAGVDVIFFDTTNGTDTWKAGYETVFRVFREARAEGVKTPKVAFMFNFTANGDAKTREELQMVYADIYYPGRYSDLWFYWEGKPLIMARKDSLNTSNQTERDIYNFFNYRENEPTYFKEDTSYAEKTWGWCSDYPQTKYGVGGDGSVEQMTVSVGQNCWNGKLTAMNNPAGAQGRSFTHGDYSYSYNYKGQTVTVDKDTENSMYYGLNFQQQWDYALETDPKFLFITGWNEWIAGRFETWQGVANALPDECNDELSRDIEPSGGELKDYYYYQMVDNIRKYKGCSTQEKAAGQKTIDINGDISQWDNAIDYPHYAGSTRARDTDGYITCHYTSDAARNDFVDAKVSYDSENVYFLAETKDDISPYTDPAWMRLLIDTDASGISDNWEGFEYILNRNSPTADEATLERSTGGWNFETVGSVKYTVSGKYMQVSVPRSMLGLYKGLSIPSFSFKWSDNMQTDGDIMDFYSYGDVAPGGRFTFSFASSVTAPLGDVTNDGLVNSADALDVLLYSIKKVSLNNEQLTCAEVRGDNEVNSADALLILQHAVNKISKFPIELKK